MESGEAKAIRKLSELNLPPLTTDIIYKELQSLGVENGMTLLVHSSLSSLGFVCGGAISVILGIIKVLKISSIPEIGIHFNENEFESGTIVMPSFSSDYSNPEYWQNPAVPWVDTVKNEWPFFHPLITPTRDMGKIAELFRTFPGVVRSNHPTCSFSSLGKFKNEITKEHPLHCELGMDSPLGKIYSLKGYILLIGVGNNVNSSLHLAENIQFHKDPQFQETVQQLSPILDAEGKRELVSYDTLDFDTDTFVQLGNDFKIFCERKEN